MSPLQRGPWVQTAIVRISTGFYSEMVLIGGFQQKSDIISLFFFFSPTNSLQLLC